MRDLGELVAKSDICPTWITDEDPPVLLRVKGRSAIDPDCLVAFADGASGRPLWIIEDSGYVCGLDRTVYAHPLRALQKGGGHAV